MARVQTSPSLNEVLGELERILAAEKTALLAGNYNVVSAASAEKERLGELLEAMLMDERRAAQLPAYRLRVKKIVEAAKQNEKLLLAAKNGAASARSRINEILGRQRMVGVYAESGAKIMAPGASVTRQKFA